MARGSRLPRPRAGPLSSVLNAYAIVSRVLRSLFRVPRAAGRRRRPGDPDLAQSRSRHHRTRAPAQGRALAVDLRPDYVGEMLGGILLTGVGVGLTLPTMIAAIAVAAGLVGIVALRSRRTAAGAATVVATS